MGTEPLQWGFIELWFGSPSGIPAFSTRNPVLPVVTASVIGQGPRGYPLPGLTGGWSTVPMNTRALVTDIALIYASWLMTE